MMHVGVDVHKRFSQVVTTDDAGRVLKRARLQHDNKPAIARFFAPLAGQAVVTMEATRNWYWLYELLESLGLDVKLANSRKVRLIAEARLKNDTIDATVLAQLERTDFLPTAYIPPRPIRDQRELLRYRITLVYLRTGLKNRIHALLDKLGINHHFSDLFCPRGKRFLATLELRPLYRLALANYLALIEDIEGRITAATQEIKQLLAPDPRAELLMTIPGVAHLTAYLLLCEIGDIGRFSTPRKLAAYGGIVPIVRESANRHYRGHITREGSSYIRWAMVEAACKAPSRDESLNRAYRRIARRRGALKARVAIARRLLMAVWYVLTYQQVYRSAAGEKID
jgi:transposase